MARLYVGTSGWSYRDWAGVFYPPELEATEWLTFYARNFSTVEINASFYRLPFASMVESWRRKAPVGFLYAVKGNRRITHLKRLRDVEEECTRFLDRIRPLGDRLGPVLWQLPPRFPADPSLLENFLDQLPSGFQYAVEFRDSSWLRDDVLDCLRAHKTALVAVSSRRMPMVVEFTGDFLYLRFHGLAGGFAHDYTEEELRPWVETTVRALNAGLDVFAYFNNDSHCRAPKNAREFQTLVSGALEGVLDA
jgi:uncharacterized protein YecE (DUF72 family)